MNQPAFRLAVAATFTAEPLEPTLNFWGSRIGEPLESLFGSYNQPLQILMDPAGVFALNRRGANVLLVRAGDLGAEHLDELARTIRNTSLGRSAPLIVCVCPEPRGDWEAAARHLQELLAGAPGVDWLDAAPIAEQYSVAAIHDEHAAAAAQVPYTTAFFCALATAIVRRALALTRRPVKLIAVDCDDTLWRGICGEDGPSGVVLDENRRYLQEILRSRRDRGALLAIVSRNNEQDVLQTFDAHPEMPLQLSDFAARKINWKEKPENLAELAFELNLGLDSFLFLDDNPKEAAEVRENEPAVHAIALPPGETQFRRFLDHLWLLDQPGVTREDLERNASYAAVQEFGRELRGSVSLLDFIRSLNLKVDVRPLTPATVRRAAQLTQRTNQFNCTAVRMSEAEVERLMDDPARHCWTVEVADRFGDYGLTGIVVFHVGEVLTVENFLLSCRVLGRGVEHRVMLRLAEEAVKFDVKEIACRSAVTARNLPARQFLDSLGPADAQGTHRLNADALLTLEWRPQEHAPLASSSEAMAVSEPGVDYGSIASELNTAENILRAMHGADSARLNQTAFASHTEEALAHIWADLLKNPSITMSDNFFDLGGHSLLAVMLVMRVRETFGIELPVDDLYTPGLSLADLATKVESYQLQAVDPEEYQALLDRIGSLSDEEVEALLNQEHQDVPKGL